MKAMVLRKTRPIEENPLSLNDVAVPETTDDEILIKVRACGVCHTDLHTVEGDLHLPRLPLIPGHQIVGTVITPPNSERFSPGDRIGVTWFFSSCGTCHFCQSGQENLCECAQFTGLHRDGGYAEYMVVKESSAFPIHQLFSDYEAAPLLCGGVIGYRALKLANIEAGQNLGMYGFGNSAHIVIQVAVQQGANVYVFTRNPKHRQLAEELGAVWVGSADDNPFTNMNSSIIFAPAGDLVPKALRVLGKGGTLVLAGITMSQIPEMDYELLYHERIIRSVANTTKKAAEELLETAASIQIQTFMEKFPLDQANEVLTMMKTGYLRAGAVLIP